MKVGNLMKKLMAKKYAKDILWYVVVLTVIISTRVLLFSPITVSGESMMPTLVDGERMITSKIAAIKRFDVVNFTPKSKPNERYIKRVIGLPGDTIAYQDDQLYVNGHPVEETYLDEFKQTTGGLLTADFTLADLLGQEKVPADHYFVLGDNRQNSTDSRSQKVGFVPQAQIKGVSKFTLWPPSKFGVN